MFQRSSVLCLDFSLSTGTREDAALNSLRGHQIIFYKAFCGIIKCKTKFYSTPKANQIFRHESNDIDSFILDWPPCILGVSFDSGHHCSMEIILLNVYSILFFIIIFIILQKKILSAISNKTKKSRL